MVASSRIPPFFGYWTRHWTRLPFEERIVLPYRYLSWFASSIFYLLNIPPYPFVITWLIVFTLLLENLLATSLYRRYKYNSYLIHLLIFTETLGMTLLLAPTGGIESHFVWYAFISVLTAAALLKPFFAWIYLIFYMAIAVISYAVLFTPEPVNWGMLVHDSENTLLVFILITFAVQLYSSLTRDLIDQSNKLERQSNAIHEANRKLTISRLREHKSTKQIVGLYQMLQTVTSQDNLIELLKTLSISASHLVRDQYTFLWVQDENNVVHFTTSSFDSEEDPQLVEMVNIEMQRMWDEWPPTTLLSNKIIANRDFLIAGVQSASHRHGIVGVEVSHVTQPTARSLARSLRLIADVTAVVLERLRLERISGRMLVIEEQNRIACEMHDNISQRLFSVVYALYALSKTWRNAPFDVIDGQLASIRGAADEANRELRAFIYHLHVRDDSTRGNRTHIDLANHASATLEPRLRLYLDEVAQLNNVVVEFFWTGDEMKFHPTLKQALFRVVSEATSNAIRHGKCSTLQVEIRMVAPTASAVIKDNGEGFLVPKVQRNASGMGLQNLQSTAREFAGSLSIDSKLKEGTIVQVTLQQTETGQRISKKERVL